MKLFPDIQRAILAAEKAEITDSRYAIMNLSKVAMQSAEPTISNNNTTALFSNANSTDQVAANASPASTLG